MIQIIVGNTHLAICWQTSPPAPLKSGGRICVHLDFSRRLRQRIYGDDGDDGCYDNGDDDDDDDGGDGEDDDDGDAGEDSSDDDGDDSGDDDGDDDDDDDGDASLMFW